MKLVILNLIALLSASAAQAQAQIYPAPEPEQTVAGAHAFLDGLARSKMLQFTNSTGEIRYWVSNGRTSWFESGDRGSALTGFARINDCKSGPSIDQTNHRVRGGRDQVTTDTNIDVFLEPFVNGIDWTKVDRVTYSNGTIIVTGSGVGVGQMATFRGVGPGIGERAAFAMEFIRLVCAPDDPGDPAPRNTGF